MKIHLLSENAAISISIYVLTEVPKEILLSIYRGSHFLKSFPAVENNKLRLIGKASDLRDTVLKIRIRLALSQVEISEISQSKVEISFLDHKESIFSNWIYSLGNPTFFNPKLAHWDSEILFE